MGENNTGIPNQPGAFISQLNEIRQNLKEMADKLQNIISATLQNDYIILEILNAGVEAIQNYSELQEDFFCSMEASFPTLSERSLVLAEKILEDAQLQLESINIAYEAFKQFQYLDIKKDVEVPESTLNVLKEWKDRAIKLMSETSKDALPTVSQPYRLFVENIKECKLSDSEVLIIESEFPGPIYSMLYRGKLCLIEKDIAVTEITAAGDKDEIICETEKKQIEIVPESKEIQSYIFRTEKEDKAFGVKLFKSEVKEFDGAKKLYLLYLIALYGVVSKEQLERCGSDSEEGEELSDNILNPLIREGYLTEITDIESGKKLYCISAKGIKIFEKKDSAEEFKRRKFKIPNCIKTTMTFKDNHKLISHLSFYNEIVFALAEYEIPDLCKKNDISLKFFFINHLITDTEIPYWEFVIENQEKKVKLIILSGISGKDIKKSGLEDALKENSADYILYVPWEETSQEVWGILNTDPFNKIKSYIAELDGNSENKSLLLSDTEGDVCTISNLLEMLFPVFIITPEECPEEEKIQPVAEDKPLDTPKTDETLLEIIPETDSVDEPHELCVTKENEYAASPAQLARKILNEYSGRIVPSEIIDLINKLLVQKSYVEAVMLAKTLSFIPNMPQYQTLYNRLHMATNMSLDSHKYSGDYLGVLDQEESNTSLIPSDELKFLRLSCFAWAYFVPDMQHDFMLHNYKDSIMSDINEILAGVSPASKQIFSLLFELHKYSPVGFSSSVLSFFRSEINRREIQSKLSAQSKDLLEIPRTHMHARLHKLPDFMQTCFGKRGDLYNCMVMVHENKVEKRDFVQKVFNSFTDSDINDNEIMLNYSDVDIENYIDTLWNNVQDGKADRLIANSPVRNTIKSNIKKRLDVMEEWLQLTGCAANDVTLHQNQLERIKKQMIIQLEASLNELNVCEDSYDILILAGISVIRNTFSKLLDYLRDSKPFHEKWDYVGLLSTCYINLNDELKPNLNANLQSVQGFEPWRRMLQHIASPKISYKEALRLIDDPESKDWYNNYSTAEHLNLYLNETKGLPITDYSESGIVAMREANQHLEDFKSKFELEYAYGSIEESTKEIILNTVNTFKDYFEENGDFARYRSFLNELEKRIDAESLQREKSLMSRMKKYTADKGLMPEKAPILTLIENTIKDKNFAVTEEYLNRLEYGELEIPDEELEVDKEFDYHGEFIKQYSGLYSICLKNKGDTPVNWGFRSISSRLNKNWQASQKKSSEELLRNWPKRKDLPENITAIRNFMSCFDFKVDKLVKDPNEKQGDKYNLFNLYVMPKEKNLRDYSHPISCFGTLISNPIHVVCLFGANSANELINTIANKLQLGGNTIVLMDGAISYNERKKVAEKFKSDTSGQNFFLLIDRVLLLFLATLDRGERLPALLKCTLPYTYYQPFVNGGGNINDEMFFGRKSELNSILNPNGACFVYGGRQLGKTALLQRASSISHKPEEKRFALYINIYEKNYERFVKDLCDELKSDRFSLIKNSHENLESLCKELSDEFHKGNISQLQIFIDEADYFLDEISKEKYSALTPFVNLKITTGSKFKFVLAGLHNVARSKSAMDRNSIFQQLGVPLCIKPLSPADARKLAERPLSYLGFKLDGRQLSLILAYTNYYPGILHFFCYTLVESVASNYRSYYSAAGDNPPYHVSDEQLRKVFVKADLNNQIKDKLEMTLKLDIRYKIIANIFAHLYYENQKQGINILNGYGIEQIRNVIDIPYLQAMGDNGLELLLIEMVNMGILWSKPDSHAFRLRKNSFHEMIGNEDAVENFLLEAASGVVQL